MTDGELPTEPHASPRPTRTSGPLWAEPPTLDERRRAESPESPSRPQPERAATSATSRPSPARQRRPSAAPTPPVPMTAQPGASRAPASGTKPGSARPSSASARTVGIMAFGTVLSRLTGLVRTLALAALGFEAVTHAYLKANTTPNLVYELVLGGVLSSTLVPLFVEWLRHPPDEAAEALSAVVTLALVGGAAGSVLLFLASQTRVLALIISGPEIGVASDLLGLFAPQVLLYSCITVLTALLQAGRRYAAPMFAPVLNNLIVIAVLVVVGERLSSSADPLATLQNDRGLLLLLGLGTTLGVAANAAALLFDLRELRPLLYWCWNPHHPVVQSMLRLSTWTVGYVACNQVALFFIQAATRSGNTDAIAYNLAATTFFQLPHGVIAVSIMSALQPELSSAYLDRDRAAFRTRLAQGLRTLIVLMIPMTIVYLVLSRPIVELLVLRGEVSLSAAHRTADTLALIALGLPAFSCYLLLMQAFKAMRNTRAPFIINAVENALNIILAGALYGGVTGLQMRAPGLGLAYALAYFFAALLAANAMAARTRGLDGRAFSRTVGRCVLAGASMALATGVVWQLLRLVLHTAASRDGGADRVRLLIEVAGAGTVGICVYAAVAQALGVTELNSFLNGVQRRLRRSRAASGTAGSAGKDRRPQPPIGTASDQSGQNESQ